VKAEVSAQATVWRGLVFDKGMPATVGELIEGIRRHGSQLGANGGKPGLMRGFQLEVPVVEHHVSSPTSIARAVREELPSVQRYGVASAERLAVCVCGDRAGALHYARRSKGHAVLMQAAVPVDRLAVDGRDFLYTVMPALCRAVEDVAVRYLVRLKGAFGDIIEEYIHAGRMLADADPAKLFRFVDHIVMDRRVIRSHLHGDVLIRGRHGTTFRSAFGVIGGISAHEILDVRPVARSSSVPRDARGRELDVGEIYTACRSESS
jgi:hypothetical protein